MNKPPAFQFYADDFIGGTITMSNEERGLYILLLCLQWTQGGLSVDDFTRLGTAIAQPSLTHVKAKFKKCDDGQFRNVRMESERTKQTEFRVSRSESGKAGAEKRWHSHSTAIAQPMANGMAKHSSPSPSPINTKKVAPLPFSSAEFEKAWNNWNEHLRQKRKPATAHASDLQLKKLSKMTEQKAIETLLYAIEHNWQGLYEQPGNATTSLPKKKITAYDCI